MVLAVMHRVELCPGGTIMKVKRIIVIMALLCSVCASAHAAGEWGWIFDINPENESLVFTVSPGSNPIMFTGRIFNNDTNGNTMSFDGLSLKTDDMLPNELNTFKGLFQLDSSIIDPGSYLIDPGKYQQITIGTFDLAKAAPGTYRFRLIGSASYDTANPSPEEVVSDYVTIDVVPEPASFLALACGTFGLMMKTMRRK